MNNVIKNHPRTILAGALSAALMFAAGGAVAQETTQDRDTTTQQGVNQGQASGHGQAQDVTHDRTSHGQTQRRDGTAQGTAQDIQRDRDWYQTQGQQVQESEGGAMQNQRDQARDRTGLDRTEHDRIQTNRDLNQGDRDNDRNRTMGDRDRDADGGVFDRDSDQPINDTWITTKVKSSLLADSDVAGLDVSVETVNGVVRLSGDVESQAQIDRAVEIARDIEGVTNVESSDLTVVVGTDY